MKKRLLTVIQGNTWWFVFSLINFAFNIFLRNGLLKLLFPVFLLASHIYNKGGIQHVKDTPILTGDKLFGRQN